MHNFQKGDFVVYKTPYKCEIGRVASVSSDTVFVCYHSGCTAAATNPADLTKIDNSCALTYASIGHHRFDTSCPDFVPEVCSTLCPEKERSTCAAS